VADDDISPLVIVLASVGVGVSSAKWAVREGKYGYVVLFFGFESVVAIMLRGKLPRCGILAGPNQNSVPTPCSANGILLVVVVVVLRCCCSHVVGRYLHVHVVVLGVL
jgi:hypothetical protein